VGRLWIAAIAVASACRFDSRDLGIADGARADAPARIDAPSGTPDAVITIDAAPGTPDAPVDAMVMIDATPACSTTGLVCPGSSPMLLACGTSDCWAGCSNGTPVAQAIAAVNCVAWGGTLARLDNLTESTCIQDSLNGAVWLGLVQADNSGSPSAGWSWNGDGVTPSYFHWAGGQPDDGGGGENNAENCAYLGTSEQWQDVSCTATFARYACRRP